MNPGISEGLAPSIIRALKRVWVRLPTTQLTKKPAGPEANGGQSTQSGDMIVPAATNTMGLIEKVIPVAERRFSILVD